MPKRPIWGDNTLNCFIQGSDQAAHVRSFGHAVRKSTVVRSGPSMPRIRFKLWHLFLLTTTAAIAIALFAIYRQHQLFPFSDVQEAAEHFNSDGRWTLVEIHGDTNGPYDWTGGGSFNNDIQKSMSYTINSDHKTHNFQLSTHNRNRGESVRYSRFTNPQDNDLLLIFVSNHDR